MPLVGSEKGNFCKPRFALLIHTPLAVPLFSKIFILVSGFENLRGHSVNFYALVMGGVIANLQGKDIVKVMKETPSLKRKGNSAAQQEFKLSLDFSHPIGLLISLLYFSDPAMTDTMGRFFRYLRKVYVDEYPRAKSESSTDDEHDGTYDWHDSTQLDNERMPTVVWLGRSNHDMIAEDASERTHLHRPPRKHRDYTRPRDPYRYRWLAVSLHWFLTKICRLTPQSTTSSSSFTLSYRTESIASAPMTQSSLLLSLDPPSNQQQPRLKVTITPPSSPEKSSLRATSAPSAHFSEKSGEEVLPRPSPTPPMSSPEEIDRLSLLSGSHQSLGYAPLDVPPHHHRLQQQQRRHGHGVALDPASISALLDWEPSNPFHPAREDCPWMGGDGLGHGWTILTHLSPTWEQGSSRKVVFVEQWGKGYLGSRWFVAE
jgi:hypothetical protein